MKRVLRLIFCALVFVLLFVCISPTVFADECKHENTYYEQVKDVTNINRYVYHHSLKCADCGIVVDDTEIRCYGGEATCTNRAICASCGEEYGALPIGHIPLQKWVFNETHHFYQCANCSLAYEKSVSEHTFSIWRITLSPTENSPGVRVRSCEICGFEQTAAVAQIIEEGENINVGLIILLVVLAIIAAAVGVFLVVWLVYYKRTMRDLLECAQALGQDLKNMVLGFFGQIVDFYSIVIKSIALFFVKIRAFFCKIGRRIRGFFLTVGIIINRCVRAVKNFFDQVRDLF